jgi:hypothetical protein
VFDLRGIVRADVFVPLGTLQSNRRFVGAMGHVECYLAFPPGSTDTRVKAAAWRLCWEYHLFTLTRTDALFTCAHPVAAGQAG